MPGGMVTTDFAKTIMTLKECHKRDMPFLAVGDAFFLAYLVFAGLEIEETLGYEEMIDKYWQKAVNVKGAFHTIFRYITLSTPYTTPYKPYYHP